MITLRDVTTVFNTPTGPYTAVDADAAKDDAQV